MIMAKNNNSLITILITLFFLLVTIDTPNAASLNSKQNEFPGLYTLDDNIELLTNDNFDKKLYGKKYSWLIEFYSSWCGHCQKFAPFWKSFALDVLDWTNFIKIGAIDCAQEDNTPVCRQFEIMGYPTVLYFHENYEAGPKNFGSPMKSFGGVDYLRAHLIEMLKNEQSKGSAKHIPSLLPYIDENVNGLWDLVENKPFVFVIVENTNSTLCAEIILDYAHVNDIVNIKCVKTNSSSILNKLSIVQIPSSPILLVVFKDLSVIPITPRNKSRTTFKNAIKVFLGSKDIDIPKQSLYEFNKDLRDSVPNFQNNIKESLNQMGDVVFQVDLENTIHYSLKHEISAMKIIDGVRYEALIDFFRVLIKYFPFGKNGIDFLTELKYRVEQSADNTITGEAISSHIHDLEQQYDPVYSLPLQWLGCRGSTPSKRGYPCGLWKLFHVLTVQSSELNPPGVDNNEVLTAMHGYIKNFFGCTHCSQHFQKMATDRKIFDVVTPDDSIIWLWESHNIVNKRLAGDETEDPSFPKVEFPTNENCQECRDSNGRWNRGEVLKYLKQVYSAQNIQKQMPDVSNKSVTSASRASRINSFDQTGGL
ncbi:sulfhydryl oxidase 2 isoform X2 [Chrysoperla carnea]|uniref:sulfhydryl oxidase 2 isoform X2 n=1 Tax=Chrysoperla carnea TaxID=189513 RepID=UPI001D05E176|nr:sulfhydryl oxidase 2 isoform X2 [Chrysoperla carnea]